MASTLVPVILSGGAGTRLWPVSRRAHPKPFMRLADGETLLEKTLARALAVAAPDAPVYTVTSRDYYFVTRDEYARTAPSARARLRYLLEPAARNTAPAVVLAALAARDENADAILLVLPADHLVRDMAAFADAVASARRLAEDGRLVVFGIPPTHPETGYGYIRASDAIGGEAFVVDRFVEKPDALTAQAYVDSGEYYWNAGMFCFRADVLLETAAHTCPDVLEAAKRVHEGASRHDDVVDYPKDAFAALPSISIDYAVMERARNRAVVPARFDWSDIGSWLAIAQQSDGDASGNRVEGDAVLIDARDNFVRTEGRTVAALGVSDLTIVETPDVVLVAHRDRAQDVKRVVDALRARNHPSVEHHQTVIRPWGSFTVLEDAPDCKVKRLVVKPGHVLSLQLHHRRTEHWTVVHGIAKVRVGDREFLLQRNESTYIPIETVHRLENPTDEDIALIEVQCGDYFGEDDIERLEDRYGRR
ncbi:MAG TPA: mannose-1-phosphate guanylyltransferase/mannose-6-phosphate isomerase [Xanthomonadales bacterium]|nr:mannose-1-phosphate guanylyltransferase/mannose-6-phosphate isomerase [Xanthomonadales bacterium]